ncbi:hypothetical protein LINGRAHAP2_LOCUS33922 [Linum grandiflorum]
MAATLSLFVVSLTVTIASLSSSSTAGVILEDGYTVSTVIDGHKLNINPYLVHPIRDSSDLVVLNYAAGVFYTAAFPTSPSEEVALKPLAGDGKVGFSDGELGSAKFNKPKNFAIDLKGNVYVADKGNHAIRKISSSGVTTIAGGSSNKVGKDDGPAQNATFSSDFELVFVAKQCALLVADHGNQLVRRIALRSEDCTTESPASPGLGAAPWWILGLGLSCVFGIAVGLAIRPYVIPRPSERPNNRFWLRKTWKLSVISLVKGARTLCSDIRSGVVSLLPIYTISRRLILLSLSLVSLMFRIKINPVGPQSPAPRKDFVSVIDADINLLSPTPYVTVSSSDGRGTIDRLIDAHVAEFAFSGKEATQVECSVPVNLGLVRRR